MSDDAYFRSRKAPGPLKTEVGKRVTYTRYFLKSIGVGPTDDLWRQTGTVKEVGDRLALVVWDGEDDRPRAVALTNLAHPGPNLRYCE